MSNDGYLPDNVTHQMVDDHFGGQEDEGAEIDIADGGFVIVRLTDSRMVIEIFSPALDIDGLNIIEDALEFNLGQARLLSQAIAERLM